MASASPGAFPAPVEASLPVVPGLSAATAGQAMPLARSAQPAGVSGGAGTIQRQAAETSFPGSGGVSSGAAESMGGAPAAVSAGGAVSSSAAAETAAPSIDEDELAERVMRRLLRTLAVEGERKGGRRWP
jgi:hypothetical protein